MLATLFAVMVLGGRAWGLGEIAIAVVILAAVCALVFVALRQFGITVPEWVRHVAWIMIVAFVVILAIRFVMSL